ncbi:MAG: DUF4862 family protein [Microbacteriaceae bacterium]|nr:DUF4862 family protein [Microbacteriaceae bacterium]
MIVGAYAASPTLQHWDAFTEGRFIDGIADLEGVRGLEVPWFGSLHRHDPEWFLANFPSDFDAVITAIPEVMRRIAVDPEYGLASPDRQGRTAALADVERLRRDVHRLVERSGRPSVIAVELHSAPRGGRASSEAFAESLQEIAAWDWAGAAPMVEHCDAWIPMQRPEKGFLSIDDEAAIAGRYGLGLVVNWGRSAIEGRDPATVLDHLLRAKAAGVLRGLVFSGACPVPGAFGEAWEDSHPPFAPSPSMPEGFHSSLLTEQGAIESLVAAGELQWVGIKFGYRATDDSVEARLSYLAQAVRAVRLAMASA